MEIKYYHAENANCCDRVKWVLDYKNIKYELIKTDSLNKEEYQLINPFLRVPGMLIDGQPLSESMVMSEFLEEVFPEFPLFPEDKFEKAKVREICEIINATIHPVQNSTVTSFFYPDLSKTDANPYREKWIRNSLEKTLPLLFQESKFAIGTAFTLADIFLIAIYNRGLSVGLAENIFPTLNEHINYCMSFDEIRVSCPIAKLSKI